MSARSDELWKEFRLDIEIYPDDMEYIRFTFFKALAIARKESEERIAEIEKQNKELIDIYTKPTATLAQFISENNFFEDDFKYLGHDVRDVAIDIIKRFQKQLATLAAKNAELVEALGEWKCQWCHGEGERIPMFAKVQKPGKCKKCNGTGLCKVAREALEANAGEWEVEPRKEYRNSLEPDLKTGKSGIYVDGYFVYRKSEVEK